MAEWIFLTVVLTAAGALFVLAVVRGFALKRHGRPAGRSAPPGRGEDAPARDVLEKEKTGSPDGTDSARKAKVPSQVRGDRQSSPGGYERRLALVQSGADMIGNDCEKIAGTVGTVPRSARRVKLEYHAILKGGALHPEQTVPFSDNPFSLEPPGNRCPLSIPGDLPGADRTPLREILEQAGAREVEQLSTSVFEGKEISLGACTAIGAVGQALFTGDGMVEPESWPPAVQSGRRVPAGYKDHPAPADGTEEIFYGEESWEAGGVEEGASLPGGKEKAVGAGGEEKSEDDSYSWI